MLAMGRNLQQTGRLFKKEATVWTVPGYNVAFGTTARMAVEEAVMCGGPHCELDSRPVFS